MKMSRQVKYCTKSFVVRLGRDCIWKKKKKKKRETDIFVLNMNIVDIGEIGFKRNHTHWETQITTLDRLDKMSYSDMGKQIF